MITDPYTGNTISPSDSVVRCPRGHVHLATSWPAAGNRCSYPNCDYVGDPISTTLLETPATTPQDIASTQPLDIRILARQRLQHPWQPILWSSLAYALITLTTFAAVAAIGWSILLSRSGVPVEVLRNYIPIDGTFFILATIAVVIATLMMTIARVFWPKR